jgi:hypothetical protein
MLGRLHEHSYGADRGMGSLQPLATVRGHPFDLITHSLSGALRFFVQEYVQGQLKKSYGDAFIRGNNGAKA